MPLAMPSAQAQAPALAAAAAVCRAVDLALSVRSTLRSNFQLAPGTSDLMPSALAAAAPAAAAALRIGVPFLLADAPPVLCSLGQLPLWHVLSKAHVYWSRRTGGGWGQKKERKTEETQSKMELVTLRLHVESFAICGSQFNLPTRRPNSDVLQL
jgi:hypothetical protein